MLTFVFLVAGCGATNTPTPAPAPTPLVPDAKIAGQYHLVLTSTNGHGTINLYTNFTQTEKTFTGAVTTLVCPSNDVSQCKGNDPPAALITPVGKISGDNVTITVAISTPAGADTLSLVGTATGINLAGTYTDSLGDAGTWTGSTAHSLTGSYSGTFNSSANPLPITPKISISLTQDVNLNLAGTGVITSSPCIGSLNFSGQAIGGAFSLTDTTNKVHITAVPTGYNFTFSYSFDPTAPSCAGDFGLGQLAIPSPWDY